MASLLGRTVEEMRASLTQRAYLDWQTYWDQEPWGPWRDNLHAAVVAREIRASRLRAGSTNRLDAFMIDPYKGDRAVGRSDGLFAALGAMARSVRPEEALARIQKRRGGRSA